MPHYTQHPILYAHADSLLVRNPTLGIFALTTGTAYFKDSQFSESIVCDTIAEYF